MKTPENVLIVFIQEALSIFIDHIPMNQSTGLLRHTVVRRGACKRRASVGGANTQPPGETPENVVFSVYPRRLVHFY